MNVLKNVNLYGDITDIEIDGGIITSIGKIKVGYDADFIIVDSDFNLVRSIARGEL